MSARSTKMSGNKTTCLSSDLTVGNTSNENVPNENTRSLLSKLIQNHLILQHISGFLSVSDLRRFRLVCRQWNQESVPIMRKRVCLHLTTPYLFRLLDHRSCNAIECSKDLYPYQQMIKHVKNLILLINSSTLGFPCVDFALTTKFVEVNPRVFHNLLEAISGFALKLRLEFDHVTCQIQMSRMQFPQLKTLNMSQPNLNHLHSEKMLRCFQHMVQNAPLLDNLQLSIDDIEKPLMSDYLSALDASSICQNLRSLYVGGEMRDEYLVKLKQLGLKLQKLSILLNVASTLSPEKLAELLHSQRNSLQELCLEKWGPASKSEITLMFPRMEKLQVLSLEVSRVQLRGHGFATQFPVLRHLVLGSMFVVSNVLKNVLDKGMSPLESLESLVVVESIEDLEALKAVARMFPKLKKLKVSGLTEKVSKVGRIMENLEELTLQLNSTQLMTGYSLAELETVEEKWRKDGRLEVETERSPDEFFQQLKFLRIVKGRLSNVLCLLGPMKLRSLQCLDLRQSPQSRISPRVLEQMRKKFRVLIRDRSVTSDE